MTPARWFPYLTTLVRARWRSGVMSFGLSLSLFPQACFLFTRTFMRAEGDAEENYSAELGFLMTTHAILLLTVPLIASRACARERESGRLAAMSTSSLSTIQLVIALIFGPACIEWMWVFLSSVPLVTMFAGDVGYPARHVCYLVSYLLLLLGATVLLLNMRMPRPFRFRGHAFAQILTALGFATISGIAMALYFGFEEEVLFRLHVVFWSALSLGIVSGSIHAGSLLRRTPPTNWSLVLRFSLPLVAAGVISFLPGISEAVAISTIWLAFLLIVGLVVTAVWDRRAYGATAWSELVVAVAGGISLCCVLAIVAWILRGHIADAGLGEGVLVGVLALATLVRYAIHCAVFQWLARCFPSFQSVVFTLFFFTLELVGITLLALEKEGWLGTLAGCLSVLAHWNAIYVAGQGMPGWDKLAPSVIVAITGGGVLVASLVVELAFWRRRKRAESAAAQAACPVEPPQAQPLPLAQHGRVDPWLRRLSPLLPVLLKVGIRRLQFSTPVDLAGLLVALTLMGFIVFDFTKTRQLHVTENSVYLMVGMQAMCMFAAVVAVFFRLRSDRQNDFLRRHARSGMRALQVCVAYLLGPGFTSIMLAAGLGLLTVTGALLAGVTQEVVGAQIALAFWLTLLIAAVFVYQTRPLSDSPHFEPLSLLVLVICGMIHLPVLLGSSVANIPTDTGDYMQRTPVAQVQSLSGIRPESDPESGGGAADLLMLPVATVFLGAVLLVALLVSANRLRWIEGIPVSRWRLLLWPAVLALPQTVLLREGGAHLFAALMATCAAMLVYQSYRACGLFGLAGAGRQLLRTIAIWSLMAVAVVFLLACLRLPRPQAHAWWLAVPGLACAAAAVWLRVLAYASLFHFLRLRLPRLQLFIGVTTYFVLDAALGFYYAVDFFPFVPIDDMPDWEPLNYLAVSSISCLASTAVQARFWLSEIPGWQGSAASFEMITLVPNVCASAATALVFVVLARRLAPRAHSASAAAASLAAPRRVPRRSWGTALKQLARGIPSAALRMLWTLALVGFAAALWYHRGPNLDFQGLAQQQREDGQYSQAMIYVEKAIRLDPRLAAAYQLRGEIYESLSEYEAAEADFLTAIQLEPQHAHYYYALAEFFLRRQAYEDAERQYTRGLEVEPDHLPSLLGRAMLHARQGRDEAARQDLRAAEAIDRLASAEYMAQRHLDAGEDEQALVELAKILEESPHATAWRRQRAETFADLGRYREAIEDLNVLLDETRDDDELYRLRGKSYYELGDYETSLLDYRAAAELNPDRAWYRLLQGLCLDELKRYDEALQAYDEALELDPDYAAAYNNKGVVFQNLDDDQQAIEMYTRAAELDPRDALYFRNRGNVYLDLGQFELAVADYSQAIELDPQDHQSYRKRADAYEGLGQVEYAIESLTAAIGRAPDEPLYFQNRGLLYQKLQQRDLAIADFSRVIQLKPQEALWYRRRAEAYASNGEPDKARQDLTSAIALDSQNEELYKERGDLYYRSNEFETALEDYRKAAELNPRRAWYQLLQGLCFAGLTRYDEALAAYDEALRLDPQYATAYNNKGVVYERRKDFQTALELYTRAVQLNDQDPLYLNNRGILYRDLGQYEPAVADFSRVIELKPEDASARRRRGDAYFQWGRYTAAADDYDAVIQLDPDQEIAYLREFAEAFAGAGQPQQALAYYERLLDLQLDVEAARQRAILYAQLGQYTVAVAALGELVEVHPGEPLPLNTLAWYLATCPDDEARDGPAAIEYARRACELTEWDDPEYLDTLAAAYAEAGQFEEAVQWQRKALEDEQFASSQPAARQRLELYENQMPYRAEAATEGEEPG